jgi:hypothetical protein
MDIQTEKIELAKRLLETNDEALLLQIKQIFESSDQDFWNVLPDHVKSGIERGRKQAEEGKLTSHDDVMKKYSKYL